MDAFKVLTRLFSHNFKYFEFKKKIGKFCTVDFVVEEKKIKNESISVSFTSISNM